jgi:tRNA nucleotidyltransferase (CCA-adding enzyme)
MTLVMSGLEADIVPSTEVGDPSKSGEKLSVERTPLHTRYVKSRLSECMKDDVRLLKSFFKSIGVYGAESHVGGFSGYVCELLVIRYGSFRKVLEAISRWGPGVYVDVEGKEDREVRVEPGLSFSRTSRSRSPLSQLIYP